MTIDCDLCPKPPQEVNESEKLCAVCNEAPEYKSKIDFCGIKWLALHCNKCHATGKWRVWGNMLVTTYNGMLRANKSWIQMQAKIRKERETHAE